MPLAVQFLQYLFVNPVDRPTLPVSRGILFIGREQILSKIYPNGIDEIAKQGGPASVHAQDHNYWPFRLQRSLAQSQGPRVEQLTGMVHQVFSAPLCHAAQLQPSQPTRQRELPPREGALALFFLYLLQRVQGGTESH